MSRRRWVRNASSTRVWKTTSAVAAKVDRCSRLVAMRRRLPLEPMTSLPLGADGVVARSAVPLSGYTTLRLGGPAARFVAAGSAEDVAGAVRAAGPRGEPVPGLGRRADPGGARAGL